MSDQLTALARLNRDLKAAAETLTPAEVRYYVSRYYTIQDGRKRAASQLRESQKAGEPNLLLQFDLSQSRAHESQIKTALLLYARSKLPGRWLLAQFGVGPVIASGFLAHIAIEKTPNAGSLWTYCGLVSRIRWVSRDEADKWVREQSRETEDIQELLLLAAAHFAKKPDILLRDATMDLKTHEPKPLTAQSLAAAVARRPWNPALKRLCYIFADCQKKFSNNPKASLYAKLYRDYKVRAIEKNLSGGFKELAEQTLETRNIRDEKTLATYKEGKLPDGRVDMWSLRATSKIFLSHLHHVLYECHYGSPPPLPYILTHQPEKHTTYIAPPNWSNGHITTEEAEIDAED